MNNERVVQDNIITLLKNLGYTFISQDDMNKNRKNNREVVLKDILFKAMKELNSFTYKGETFKFSNKNINKAIDDLDVELTEGMNVANEKIYDKLILGEAYTEEVKGDRKSYSLKYIDLGNPKNNVYHFTEEFEVRRLNVLDNIQTRRPDIVVFVNGIPLGIIELKSGIVDYKEGISQMIRNQGEEEIPYLFKYSQILIAGNTHTCKFGTTNTQGKFYSVWKEEVVEELKVLCERELPTVLDQTIYSLLRPIRLLNIIKSYIVFDGKVKKVSRYQQYFAVEKVLNRVSEYRDNKRRGGLIWHTQGSGKSLTMLMLARSLRKQVKNSKVVIVTDRKSLDSQITTTFKQSSDDRINGIVRATSGQNLFDLIEKGETLISTLINKFGKVREKGCINESSDIFVLIDESHRSNFGTLHASMKKVFPNACYLGFTGTPLLKKEKNSLDKFHGIIDTYKINEAVENHAVLPLLYEGRVVEQWINDKAGMDRKFELMTKNLNEKQTKDLKQKYAIFSKVASSSDRLLVIAMDINEHFIKNIQGTVFKAMLATNSKYEAVKYYEHFKKYGDIKTAYVISSNDTREGFEKVNQENKKYVTKEYAKLLSEQGCSEEEYEQKVKNQFIDGDLDLLIVVDKLLTGFDAPKAQYLYIDKPLKEHKLLQAIARVNRLEEGKDFGIVIDYRGLLGNLEQALNTYSEFEGYEESDISGTLTSITEEIRKLKEKYSYLKDLFKPVMPKDELEAYILFLEDEEKRNLFYDYLKEFAKTMKIAFASEKIFDVLSYQDITKFKKELVTYEKLRKAVRIRYQEAVDFGEYEEGMQKLLDTYISNGEVNKLTKLVNIFDKKEFDEQLKKVDGQRARADVIRHAVSKIISEKYEDNPAFYDKLSKRIEGILEEYQKRLIDDAKLLIEMNEVKVTLQNGDTSIIRPKALKNSKNIYVIYDNIHDMISDLQEEAIVEIVHFMHELFLDKSKKPDWKSNKDVKNQIYNNLEDYLYDYGLDFSLIDKIFKIVYELGLRNYGR